MLKGKGARESTREHEEQEQGQEEEQQQERVQLQLQVVLWLLAAAADTLVKQANNAGSTASSEAAQSLSTPLDACCNPMPAHGTRRSNAHTPAADTP